MDVPNALLLSFFRSATNDLKDCRVDQPTSLEEIRSILLSTQRNCLQRVTAGTGFAASGVQERLKELGKEGLDSDVQVAMSMMNDTARLVFCRLTLRSECLYSEQADRRHLKTTGSLSREDLLEFIGLCNVAVDLDNVQRYISNQDAKLFDDLDAGPTDVFPQKRLEWIQRCFLRAIGYSDDFGYNEIKRIFFTPRPNEYSSDREVVDLFASMGVKMDKAVTAATMLATESNFDGVTRVVSVQHSEKLVDVKTGKEVVIEGESSTASAPMAQAMDQQAQAQQRQELHMARETARLNQELLGELLSMRDEEREEKLALAKAAAAQFMQNVSSLPPGPERVAVLESLDPKTQRLMIMDKLWAQLVEQNGGKPPEIRYPK